MPEVCPAPDCHTLKPAGVHKCPACGFAPEKQSTIEVREGELKELKANEKRNKSVPNEKKQEFYSAALSLAQEKGRSEGWAAHLYKKYFSVWPNKRDKSPGPITDEVRQYAHAMDIRYAKARNRRAAA